MQCIAALLQEMFNARAEAADALELSQNEADELRSEVDATRAEIETIKQVRQAEQERRQASEPACQRASQRASQ